jgi:hypothetical protein
MVLSRVSVYVANNYTKSSVHKSTSELFKLTGCSLLLSRPAYDRLQTTFVVSCKPSARIYRKHVTSFLFSEFISALAVA